jgi:peptide/nickel transport system permease protein
MATAAPPARRRRSWRQLPVVHQLRQSVGLQRGMLVAGLVLMGVFVLAAIFAPLLAPYEYGQLRDADGPFGAHQPPSADHWLGTTVGGFDVLSRTIWGARTALLVIVVAVLLSIVAGVLLGLVSGYFGGWLDRVLVVIADAIYAFPTLLLAIVVAIVISGGQSSLWGGIFAAAISITVVFIPQYLRVVRAETVRIKAEAFVESARVIGASNWRIMTRHVLRNATRTLPLILTLNASEAILTLAGLGFLGFGIQPTAARRVGLRPQPVHLRREQRHLVDVGAPRRRHRAHRARADAGRREPQRPGRPTAADPPARRRRPRGRRRGRGRAWRHARGTGRRGRPRTARRRTMSVARTTRERASQRGRSRQGVSIAARNERGAERPRRRPELSSEERNEGGVEQ